MGEGGLWGLRGLSSTVILLLQKIPVGNYTLELSVYGRRSSTSHARKNRWYPSLRSRRLEVVGKRKNGRARKKRWYPSLRSRRLEVVGTRKNGRARRRHALRVSLARARSLSRPLLPSACYAGYWYPGYGPRFAAI